MLATGRASLFRLCKHSGLQPFPEFFDAPRTLVGIAVLARRHFVRPPVPSTRSRMNVVGSQDKVLFGFSVSFPRLVQPRAAVPAPAATLHPEVLPPEFRRIQGKFHSSEIVGDRFIKPHLFDGLWNDVNEFIEEIFGFRFWAS